MDIAPTPGKIYKLFLVELDDDNRERVIAGRVANIEMTHEPVYEDVYSISGLIHKFMSEDNITITMKMIPSGDGTYFTIENFMEEDE